MSQLNQTKIHVLQAAQSLQKLFLLYPSCPVLSHSSAYIGLGGGEALAQDIVLSSERKGRKTWNLTILTPQSYGKMMSSSAFPIVFFMFFPIPKTDGRKKKKRISRAGRDPSKRWHCGRCSWCDCISSWLHLSIAPNNMPQMAGFRWEDGLIMIK